MKPLLLLPLLSLAPLLAPAAAAQGVLKEYSWSDADKHPAETQIVPSPKGPALQVRNANDAPLQINALTIENPGIGADFYALSGEVSYENVAGDGYLEMWSVFPPEKPGGAERRFFSRTLGGQAADPMAKLHGSSDWRPFLLPFNATGAGAHPVRLILNVVLPGKGTVRLGPLKLTQGIPGTSAGATMLPLGGASGFPGSRLMRLGLLATGLLLGCLACVLETLASRGQARAWVLAGDGLEIALGLAALALGLWLLAMQAPWTVWLPWVFLGGYGCIFYPFRWQSHRRLYQHAELRRMTALDALS
jgi:hypothetical protein